MAKAWNDGECVVVYIKNSTTLGKIASIRRPTKGDVEDGFKQFDDAEECVNAMTAYAKDKGIEVDRWAVWIPETTNIKKANSFEWLFKNNRFGAPQIIASSNDYQPPKAVKTSTRSEGLK